MTPYKRSQKLLDLQGKVFDSYVLPSHRHKMIDYVVVWPKRMFSCEGARELTKKDHGIQLPKTPKWKKPTMHNVFDHGVIHYKIYFLKLDINEEIDKCLSEVDSSPVATVREALDRQFERKKIMEAREKLFLYAKEMLKPVPKLELRREPEGNNILCQEVIALYRFVAKHTPSFPWFVLSPGAKMYYLQQQVGCSQTGTTHPWKAG